GQTRTRAPPPAGTGPPSVELFLPRGGGALGARAAPPLRLAALRPRRGHGASHPPGCPGSVARSRRARQPVGVGPSGRQEQGPRCLVARPDRSTGPGGVGRPPVAHAPGSKQTPVAHAPRPPGSR